MFWYRGVPKKRLKKAASRSNTELSIVVATPSVMQFPRNENVERATAKRKNRNTSSSSLGAKKTKGSGSSASNR